MRTLSDRGQEEGSAPAAAQDQESTAEPRACARAIVALPPPAALVPVTGRARSAGHALARVAEVMDRPGSLVHARPPSLARAREAHREAAARHETAVLRHLRLLWGYAHLIFVKSALNLLEWVTETPLRFLVAVILGAVIWYWS